MPDFDDATGVVGASPETVNSHLVSRGNPIDVREMWVDLLAHSMIYGDVDGGGCGGSFTMEVAISTEAA